MAHWLGLRAVLIALAIVAGALPLLSLASPDARVAPEVGGLDEPRQVVEPGDRGIDVADVAVPLEATGEDYEEILSLVGDATVVLIGEATHGTHEFYEARAEITRRLIEEKGFDAVALEADWPAAYRVNRYVRGEADFGDAEDALSGFRRFPTWMWRNNVVLDFVEWLRAHNAALPSNGDRVGVYGLDLYSLYESADEVVAYLEGVDADAAAIARARYDCLTDISMQPEEYGYLALVNDASCEDDVVAQYADLLASEEAYTAESADAYFNALQNARVVVDAERYYRTMYLGTESSWNLRDTHMFETLEALRAHLGEAGSDAKVVVWAHNSHVGDASATASAERGELNIGQLAREAYGDDAVLIGFTTYTGTVTAASEWETPALQKFVLPSLPDSYGDLFHEAGLERFLVPLRTSEAAQELLDEPRLQRAIGVLYLPETERWSHYLYANLAEQFDAVIHIDETTALQPLETTLWEPDELSLTYPFGE